MAEFGYHETSPEIDLETIFDEDLSPQRFDGVLNTPPLQVRQFYLEAFKKIFFFCELNNVPADLS